MDIARFFIPIIAGKAFTSFSIDFSTLADGAIPTWDGATFSIVSGRMVNNPTLLSELFDPGADIFTSGTYGWVAEGGNSIANVDNELEVTYVDNASGAYLTLENAKDLTADLVPGKWYLYSCKAYKSGTGNNTLMKLGAGDNNNVSLAVSTTSLADYRIAFYHVPSTSRIKTAGLGTGRKFYLDNQSIKNITHAHLFSAPTNSSTRFSGDLVVRVSGINDDTNADFPHGVFCCMDNLSNPLNYVYAVLDRYSNFRATLYKVVNGTQTLLRSGSPAYVANKLIEIRRTGAEFQLWYNDSQVGESVTISDAGIVANNIHGIFNSGGGLAGATNFFLGRP